MKSSEESEKAKKEVMCERCGKPLGAGGCPRCKGIKIEKDKGIYLMA